MSSFSYHRPSSDHVGVLQNQITELKQDQEKQKAVHKEELASVNNEWSSKIENLNAQIME